MSKNEYTGLSPEVAANLELSIIEVFNQWKEMINRSLESVSNLNTMIDTFYREENEMMQRWENEGGLCLYD